MYNECEDLVKTMTSIGSKLCNRINSLEECNAKLEARIEKRNEVDGEIGGWLSAALDDPEVCKEMKQDIVAWFTEQPVKGGKNEI